MTLVSLTDEQWALCAEYLRTHPNLSAVAYTIHPGMHGMMRARGCDDEDIHSIALYGAVVAASKFDPGRKTKFSTLAGWQIWNEMHQACAWIGRDKRNPERGKIVSLTGTERMTWQPDDSEERQEEIRRRVAVALRNIDAKERDLLERQHGLNGREPERLIDIARKKGVTKQAVFSAAVQARKRVKLLLGSDTPELLG